MIKVLWFRFRQCFRKFIILLHEASSETGLFRHLSDSIFGVQNLENEKVWGSSLCVKCLEFNLDLKNAAGNWESLFCFWDSCIWIAIDKFFLLRTGYLSSAANVLTSSPKILHVNKRDFCQLNWILSRQWISKRVCDADFNSPWARLPCCLSKSPLKRDFSDIYLTTFWESVISEVQKLWGSSFFLNLQSFS